MPSTCDRWNHWETFRAAQHSLELAAGLVAHLPVTIRYIDVGQPQQGTILLMHGIPTWSYLYPSFHRWWQRAIGCLRQIFWDTVGLIGAIALTDPSRTKPA